MVGIHREMSKGVFVLVCCFLICCLLPPGLQAQNPSGMIVPADSTVKDTTGQRDLIGIVLHLTHIHIQKPPKVDGRRVYYSLIPISTSVPGGGNALVTSTTAGFYLGDRHDTYLSNVTFSPGFNFRGQFNFPFRSNIWSPHNNWNYQGDMRFSIFPKYTWGLGGDQINNDKLLIKYEYVRLYQNALKRIRPYLLVGFGYNLDYDINIHTNNDTVSLEKFSGYSYGVANHSNSFSSGVTFNLLYDTRNNSINPLPGAYFNLIYRVNPKFLGSDGNWQSLYMDMRKYLSFSQEGQNVLAIWTYLWTTLRSSPPYLNLPAVGWDTYQRSGRAFYPSRYTGKSLYYLETEYRRDITDDGLLGFVLFTELTTTTEPNTYQFEYLHPGAGAGMRIKFNKRSGTNVAVDFGFSKGYYGVSINLGEAF
jgi:surface antigen Omp85-like protein